MRTLAMLFVAVAVGAGVAAFGHGFSGSIHKHLEDGSHGPVPPWELYATSKDVRRANAVCELDMTSSTASQSLSQVMQNCTKMSMLRIKGNNLEETMRIVASGCDHHSAAINVVAPTHNGPAHATCLYWGKFELKYSGGSDD